MPERWRRSDGGWIKSTARAGMRAPKQFLVEKPAAGMTKQGGRTLYLLALKQLYREEMRRACWKSWKPWFLRDLSFSFSCNWSSSKLNLYRTSMRFCCCHGNVKTIQTNKNAGWNAGFNCLSRPAWVKLMSLTVFVQRFKGCIKTLLNLGPLDRRISFRIYFFLKK